MNRYKRHTFLIVLIAPSGGGKSTILRRLIERRPDIAYSVSSTTRAPRVGEVDGRDYVFLSREEFTRRREQGQFFETAEVHGNLYGTSRVFIRERLDEGRHVVLDIDVQGADAIVNGGLPVVTVFLMPPGHEVLKQRLHTRGADSDETIALRLRNAHGEVARAHDFNYLVINDDLDEAVNEVLAIVRAEENRISRYESLEETFWR
ncbi:MAG: guanylate kinase [Candidatus Cloacimonetes bacterium]|nr:guanylate kinase [Candidatus Cloacimonadota bacterium]